MPLTPTMHMDMQEGHLAASTVHQSLFISPFALRVGLRGNLGLSLARCAKLRGNLDFPLMKCVKLRGNLDFSLAILTFLLEHVWISSKRMTWRWPLRRPPKMTTPT